MSKAAIHAARVEKNDGFSEERAFMNGFPERGARLL
jgi:hypothetical protein